MAYETICLKREELYEQVWSRPLRGIAKDYSLSDVGLAKICRRLKVPLPGRGYWAQRDAGKVSPKPPLPPLGKGDLAEVEVSRQKPSGFVTQALSEVEQFVARESLPENKITVASTLVSPHALVTRTAQFLRAAKPSDTGLVHRPIGKSCLDIRVTPTNLDRALRIMDALIKTLETRGYGVSIDIKHKDATTVTLLGQALEIRFEEGVKRTDHAPTPEEKKRQEKYPWSSPPRYDFQPTGELSLRILDSGDGKRRNWADSSKRRLEDCLNDFIASLVQVAAVQKGEQLEREDWRRRWEEERHKQEEEVRLRQEEAARLEVLEKEAAAWQRSERIRSYVGAVKEAVQHQGDNLSPDSHLERWLVWALEQADRLDPLPKRLSYSPVPENTPS